jgi:hypothetical protein
LAQQSWHLPAHRVLYDGTSYQWLIPAYLTVLTGAFTVGIPGVNSKFTVSDTFIFINTILFGTAPGVLTGALDRLVSSIRCKTTSRRKQTIPFNVNYSSALSLPPENAPGIAFVVVSRTRGGGAA